MTIGYVHASIQYIYVHTAVLSSAMTTGITYVQWQSTVEAYKEAKCLGKLKSLVNFEFPAHESIDNVHVHDSAPRAQGSCNPLTACSIFNTYVLPMLIHSYKSWNSFRVKLEGGF